EKIWMLPFSSSPGEPVLFEIPDAGRGNRGKGVAAAADSDAKAKAMAGVRDFASKLRPHGGTALYDSILVALENMAAEKEKHPEYQYSVVGFTDGENSAGRDFAAFKAAHAGLSEDARAIPVFMVLFGDAKEAELQ